MEMPYLHFLSSVSFPLLASPCQIVSLFTSLLLTNLVCHYVNEKLGSIKSKPGVFQLCFRQEMQSMCLPFEQSRMTIRIFFFFFMKHISWKFTQFYHIILFFFFALAALVILYRPCNSDPVSDNGMTDVISVGSLLQTKHCKCYSTPIAGKLFTHDITQPCFAMLNLIVHMLNQTFVFRSLHPRGTV